MSYGIGDFGQQCFRLWLEPMLTYPPCTFVAFNLLWLNEAICLWEFWSILLQAMATCLMATSHYLKQCWLIINEALLHSTGSHFKGSSWYQFPKWTCISHFQNNTTISQGTMCQKHTVYPKKYAYGFSFVVLCCGYTLTDFPISIRLTSLALWQSNDCPNASKATLMNMDKYFMWIHYERLHNHNKAKHNKTVCIFLGIYCMISTGWHIQILVYKYIMINRFQWWTFYALMRRLFWCLFPELWSQEGNKHQNNIGVMSA